MFVGPDEPCHSAKRGPEPDKRLCLSRTKKCILTADGTRPME
jgi:hypothetical protein